MFTVISLLRNKFQNWQALVRDPKEAGLKKNSAAVVKYLEELVKIGNYSITLCHVSIYIYIYIPTTIVLYLFICFVLYL